MKHWYLFDLNIIKSIQSFRNDFLDEFFKFMNFFDTPIFYYLLLASVAVSCKNKTVFKIFFVFLFSFIINYSLKNIFMLPRPFHQNASLEVIFVKGYGFPSGATQSAVVLSSLLINSFRRKKIAWVLGVSFFVLIGLSRLYLGVHFLLDVIGGVVIGGFLTLCYMYIFDKLSFVFSKLSILNILALEFMVILLAIFYTKSIYVVMAIYFFCINIVYFLNKKYDWLLNKPSNKKETIFRIVVAALGIVFVFFLHKFLDSTFLSQKTVILRQILYFFWMFFGSHVFIRWLTKKTNLSSNNASI